MAEINYFKISLLNDVPGDVVFNRTGSAGSLQFKTYIGGAESEWTNLDPSTIGLSSAGDYIVLKGDNSRLCDDRNYWQFKFPGDGTAHFKASGNPLTMLDSSGETSVLNHADFQNLFNQGAQTPTKGLVEVDLQFDIDHGLTTEAGMNNLFWQCQALSKIKLDWTIWKAGYNSNAGTPSNGEYFLKRELLESGTMTDRYNTGWSIYVSDESPTPLRFTFRSAGTIKLNKVGTFTSGSAEYRTDLNQDWQPYEFGDELQPLADGWIEFRGNDVISQSSSKYHQFVISGTAEASGYITSLFNKDYAAYSSKNYCAYKMFENCSDLQTAPELPLAKLASNCYASMFYYCTGLRTAPELPATTLASNCYQNMFQGCSALQTAPELPATTLAASCYSNMFNSCNGLRTAPELPATKLASNCYQNMFYGCKGLRTAPELPATTLSQNCYQNMFQECSALRTAPELPATTLVSYCYASMFNGCTSLTSAPELPATTLQQYCYSSMFNGCRLLTTAPELPATTLYSNCYQNMFYGCTSLTTAPELPATKLASSCYSNMFLNCTSLTTAPELPATTLASSCYSGMFQNCTSLTTAPELPATTLASSCYSGMFFGCTLLDKIVYTGSVFGNANTWLSNVSSTGTFYYTDQNLNVAAIPRTANGVPASWTIQYRAPKPSLVFSINGRAVASLTINGKAVAKLG